ncbi:unnamed protein product, partial [Rodentolepis nana]|uniref:Secreted protein n=1 Tax=Rodentolepis nana TaxID=102285 RepID=A0A0R3TDB7_RODNA
MFADRKYQLHVARVQTRPKPDYVKSEVSKCGKQMTSTTPTATEHMRPFALKMWSITLLLSIALVISHGTAVGTGSEVADRLRETTQAAVEEAGSSMSGTPDVVSPTNDSISDLTGQQNFSGIEETLNATNNSNSSPSA